MDLSEKGYIWDEEIGDYIIPEVPYSELCKYIDAKDFRSTDLILIWGKELNRNKQMLLLRKIYPVIAELTSKQMRKVIEQNEYQWKFAEMRYDCAKELAEKGKKLGLDIVLEVRE